MSEMTLLAFIIVLNSNSTLYRSRLAFDSI